ncbi:hematopoietic cell signal transducer [Ranitomeya imitator]|uniref:hematopoietic cell signal transducer n=1 Tax=Ranitomeya imitator TaxID=111125 RepID=UPI0037E8F024
MTMIGTLQLVLCSFLFWLPRAFASPSEPDLACGDCYRIDTPILVGVVLGDIALTIIIMLVVYYCTKQSFQRRPVNDDGKVYMNMPMSR